jgi:hypothetical protein
MGMVQPIAGSAGRPDPHSVRCASAAVCYGRAVRELTKACGVGRCHLDGFGDLLNGPFKMAGAALPFPQPLLTSTEKTRLSNHGPINCRRREEVVDLNRPL